MIKQIVKKNIFNNWMQFYSILFIGTFYLVCCHWAEILIIAAAVVLVVIIVAVTVIAIHKMKEGKRFKVYLPVSRDINA